MTDLPVQYRMVLHPVPVTMSQAMGERVDVTFPVLGLRIVRLRAVLSILSRAAVTKQTALYQCYTSVLYPERGYGADNT